MLSPDSHTAVLLFALPDAVEAGRKPVADQSDRVWRAMRTLTRAKVRAAGLPLLESARLIDHHGTFGEQFSAAVSAVFDRGYDRVICLGNDCPDLSIADLKRAANALVNNQLAIGPDHRGGVYLVAIDRARFNADGLSQLPWQTTRLADALRLYFSTHGAAIAELPVRSDLNHRADATALHWLGQVSSRLLSTLRQALLPVRVAISLFVSTPSTPVRFGRLSGRAPPGCA